MHRLILSLVILAVMVLAALLLLQGDPTLDEIDRLVKASNVQELTRKVEIPANTPNPFHVLRTRGAYDTGRFGWSAMNLAGPSGEKYIVIATALTSEDVGEIVLRQDGTKLTYVPETDPLGITIHRHDFNLRLEPATKKAILSDNMTFTSEPGRTGSFIFRMSPQYKVSSITADGKTVPFKQASGVVLAQRPNGKATYEIQYEATVDLQHYAGSISTREATLVNDYWYPMVARQPVPYDITLHVPSGWMGVAQGEMVSKTGNTSRFKMDLPVVYYSVSAGPYKRFSQKIGDREYWAASPRMTEDQLKIQTELYAPILDFYEKSFGKYPFKEWGVLDSPAYGGGALEAYSYATWGGGLPDEDAHEPAHTWWGGILNNTYLGSFWNESFAEFSHGLYQRNVPIGNIDERRLAFIRDGGSNPSYDRVAIIDGGAFAGPIAGSLGYGKGGLVLQMLETYLGTEKMVETMREWVKVDAGKAVDWPDYERVVHRLAPEKNLQSFFDDWLRKPGSADLKITNVKHAGNELTFDVGFAGGAYRIPLEVMLQSPTGERTFHLVDVPVAGSYKIVTSAKPALISFDPWNRLLRKMQDDEEPETLVDMTRGMRAYRDPSKPEYMRHIRLQAVPAIPADTLKNIFIIGHPDSAPRMKYLCDLAGFQVEGNKLTYKGTTIDLDKGGAMAIVDLPGGGKAGVALGTTIARPDIGRARVALVDEYGRFLRGVTDPKTTGPLTFRL